MKFKLFIFIIAFAFSLVSCRLKHDDKSPVVASVGKAKLTLKELKDSFPLDSGLGLSSVQIQKFVQRWIESELIYQQAVREGVANRADVKKRIKASAKDYIVSTYTSQYTNQSLKVAEDEIKRYYDKNSDEFIRPTDQYRLHLILVGTYREANAIRRELLQGTDFAVLARDRSIDESKGDGGELGWIKLNSLLPDLAAKIPRLSLNSPSFPIKTSVGYYIVEPQGVRNKGKVQTLDEVREIIKMRIKVTKREQNYRRLVNKLGEKTEFSTDWSVLKDFNVDSTKVEKNL